MQRKISQWLFLVLVVTNLLVTGCSATSAPNTEVSTSNLSSRTQLAAKYSYLPKLNGKATVVMTVNGSPITIEVDGINAPLTAGNFVDLVQKGVYDGLAFHRVVREPQPFVVQGGDPQSKDLDVPINNLGTGGFIDPKTSKERYIPLWKLNLNRLLNQFIAKLLKQLVLKRSLFYLIQGVLWQWLALSLLTLLLPNFILL